MATAFLEVLGTGALGSTPSVVISTESERVLFDCGDGTQRLCTEHGVRVSKLSRIFLTTLAPRATGGLGGMLLTRADIVAGAGQQSATAVLGPPGTCGLVKSFRFFYSRPDARVDVYEASSADAPPEPGPDALTVEPILLGGSLDGAKGGDAHGPKRVKPLWFEDVARHGLHVHACAPPPLLPARGGVVSDGADVRPPLTCSYVIKLPFRRGKFIPAKAQALGVRPGPDFGRLSRGESVQANGRLVAPDECMELPEPVSVALVLACPDAAQQDWSAVECAVAPYLAPHAQQRLVCVVHMSPRSVVAQPSYAAFVARAFAAAPIEHIGLGEGVSPARCLLLSSAALQARFHDVEPACFAAALHEPAAAPPPFVRAADVGTRFVLAPFRSMGKDDSHVPAAATAAFAAHGHGAAANHDDGDDDDAPAVTFLGTGSAVPSKYRNVSSLLLWPRGVRRDGLLVDAGEGALGQLMRVRGSCEAGRAAMDGVACAWISHMHADHHLGLLAIIAHRATAAAKARLHVVGPKPLGFMLAEFGDALGDGGAFNRAYTFADAEQHAWPEDVVKALGISQARSVAVEHCQRAYALVVDGAAAWRFVYSGDTMPCAALERAGEGATLLVHEATFEDGMEAEARDKKHSTVSQAVAVAQRMGARNLVLTHFSQRYPKLPPALAQHAAVAFDLMHVRFDGVGALSGLVPRLSAALQDVAEEE